MAHRTLPREHRFLASRRVLTSLPFSVSAQHPAPLPLSPSPLSPLLRPPFPNLAARRTSHQPDTTKLEAPPERQVPYTALAPLASAPSGRRAPPGERSPRRSVGVFISLVLGVLGTARVSVLGVQKFRLGSPRLGCFLVLGNAMVSCCFGCGFVGFS